MILLRSLMSLSAVQLLFSFLSLDLVVIITGLIALAINGYQYMTINQLYEVFKSEFESRDNSRKVQYQTHGRVQFIAWIIILLCIFYSMDMKY